MQTTTLRRSVKLSIALLALIALAAAAYGPGAGAATRKAPCTKAALTAGLERGQAQVPDGRIVKPYACAGYFAYAAVIVEKIEVTTVFRARGTGWITVNRGPTCKGHAIPSNIYKQACETN